MTEVKPTFYKGAFTCPFCHAHVQMHWRRVSEYEEGLKSFNDRMRTATCGVCGRYSVWMPLYSGPNVISGGMMIYPTTPTRRTPKGIPEICKSIYEEAADVETRSPRAAAALLRLCIEHLCDAMSAKGDNIGQKIRYLVSEGLPQTIQQALDSVRIIGNNAVHPGKIDFDDKPQIVEHLFHLVDFIVEHWIARPMIVKSIYDSLPQGALDDIRRKDSAKKSNKES